MKIDWVSPVEDSVIGNSLGYGLANKRLRESFSKICEISQDSDTAFHFCHPQHYKPDFSKKNIVYTMCEHEWLSEDFYHAFLSCDAIITPSEFCRDTFIKAGCSVPIHVSPLGVDTERFSYRRRKWKAGKQKFRFMYLGAPNVRKFSLLEELYKDVLIGIPGVELYIKTTGADLMGHDNGTNFVKSGNWIIDNRKVSDKEIVKLYHKAHCSLFPHMGEGFGMTALEALSTGLPLVVSDYASTAEFCNNKNSYPIPCKEGVVDAMIEERRGSEVRSGKIVKVDTMIPTKEGLYEAIFRILKNYDEALGKAIQGRQDATRMTWGHAAKKLLSAIEAC